MKSKQELKKIATQIAECEDVFATGDITQLDKIEQLAQDLSFEEMCIIDDIILKNFS